MDIEYSLIAKYAGYFFQTFRLYVVYEGKNKEQKISQLRDRVKDWDR